MVERLKQIWGGFEKGTERRLTNRGVDNIEVPSRRDYRAEGETPAAIEPPATAAFEALKARLASHGKKSKREEAGATDASFAAESEAARDLIRGLKATEARIVRSERLYTGEGVKEKRSLFGGRKSGPKKGFKLF